MSCLEPVTTTSSIGLPIPRSEVANVMESLAALQIPLITTSLLNNDSNLQRLQMEFLTQQLAAALPSHFSLSTASTEPDISQMTSSLMTSPMMTSPSIMTSPMMTSPPISLSTSPLMFCSAQPSTSPIGGLAPLLPLSSPLLLQAGLPLNHLGSSLLGNPHGQLEVPSTINRRRSAPEAHSSIPSASEKRRFSDFTIDHLLRVPEDHMERRTSTTRKQRTIYGLRQTEVLEEAFHNQRYLVGAEREELANRLGLSEAQVRVWFQNRRSKQRKLSKQSVDDKERAQPFERMQTIDSEGSLSFERISGNDRTSGI